MQSSDRTHSRLDEHDRGLNIVTEMSKNAAVRVRERE